MRGRNLNEKRINYGKVIIGATFMTMMEIYGLKKSAQNVRIVLSMIYISSLYVT